MKKLNSPKWLFSLAFFIICLRGLCNSLSIEDEAQIDEFIETVMACAGLPGLSLAAVQDGEIVLSKGYGKANLEEDIDFDEHTLLNLASVTKAFTSFLLAVQLGEDNNSYNWNTPIKDILGESFHLTNGYYSNQTTVKDLLAHKTGFPQHDRTRTFDMFDREEFMQRVRFIEPAYPFRTEFVYNNIMYMVAAVASSAMASDKPWEDLIKERLFDPIGMPSAMFTMDAPSDYEGFAVPYLPFDGDLYPVPAEYFKHYRSTGPAGGIAASANDMALWMQFLLNDATTQDGNQLLSTDDFQSYMLADFSRPSSSVAEYPVMYKPLEKYGKAWNTGFYKGLTLVSHTGTSLGINTLLYLLPDVDLGVYVGLNTNENNDIRILMLPFIIDVLMGEDTWTSADDICFDLPLIKNHYHPLNIDTLTNKYLTNIKQNIIFDSDETYHAEAFEGEYGNFLYGNVTIAPAEGNENLELIYGKNGLFELVSTEDENIFLLNGMNIISAAQPLGLVIFEMSQGDGVIDKLHLPQAEPLDPPVFIRGLNIADAPPPDISSCK